MKLKRTDTNFLKNLLAGLLVVSTLSSTAHAWWNNEWTVRKKITLDTKSAGIIDPIGTVAVLIRLHDGDFQFAAAKDDGSDLRLIAADDKTLLTYHIEKYDSLLSEAFVWVKIPDVKPGGQISFWLYYGNNGNKATKTDDTKGTFDADTVLVYHFAEHGQLANDSTASGNNAQTYTGIPVDGSMIGAGLRLNGRSVVTIPATASLAWTDGGTMTWSAWIKPAVLQPNAVIYSRRDGDRIFLVGVDNGIPFIEVNGQRSKAGEAIAVNSWHHLAAVAGDSTIRLYLDGEPYATLNASLPAMNTTALIGAGSEEAVAAEDGFHGELDELNISKIARPAGFIKLAAINQGGGEKAGKLLALGADEQPTNWLSWLKGGYFGIIISSLTLDGWVVIGILMIMAVISWFVMISKASYLNAASRGNALFMKEWRHLSTDLTALDDGDIDKVKTLGGRVDKQGQRALRNAGVYRIYHIGAEEIRHRLASDKIGGGTKALKSRSIQAIRASLDSGLVRETQKLNSMMVLLTIAISGGPFLGLLGTVVGVMITFAAVAAAGEVNVNAIAPGIAAALLATVAGLAVAIPSLFGYNYLVSRVKDTTSDMHVFIDEFVTKMAEFYGGKTD